MTNEVPPAPVVVAIDGPSGSGKSSVSRGVAQHLGLEYLDTGATYRAATWWMLRWDIDPNNSAAVAELAAEPRIDSGTDPAAPTIAVDGRDVAEAIRTPEVTSAVSAVSAVPELRRQLVDYQRQVVRAARARGHGIVVEGRDIGSHVLPEADVKVFLTADPAVRAQRRAAEDAGRDHGTVGAATTEAELLRRDAMDSGRATSPLRRTGDSVEIDATNLTLPEVIEAVVSLVRATTESGSGRRD